MLLEKTQKFIDKYEVPLLAGTLSDDDLECLHIEIQVKEGTDAPNSMTLMLDFVSAVAPKMQAEILHALVDKLVTAELARKTSFMRDSCIAKYFLAYQACYYPGQVQLFLKAERLKAALFLPTSSDDKELVILAKFQNVILGSSQVSLLLHMAKVKASSSPPHAAKIKELELKSLPVYHALAQSPTNPDPLKKFLASLIKFNDSLNSPSNTTYLEPLSQDEGSGSRPSSAKASAVGLFRRVCRSISSIGSSPKVCEEDPSRASQLSSRPASRATPLSSLKHGGSVLSLISDSAVASPPQEEDDKQFNSPTFSAV